MQYKRFSYLLWVILLCLALGLGLVRSACAQNLNSINLDNKTNSSQQATADPEALRQSLDLVIHTLENDAQRQALLQQLKSLRNSTNAEVSDAKHSEKNRGLLGALADSFDNLGKYVETRVTPADIWLSHSRRALADIRALFTGISRVELRYSLIQAGIGLSVWLGLVFVLTRGGRQLFERHGWPLILPPEPRPWLLLAHFLRRTLPVLLIFVGLLFSMSSLGTSTAARVVVLVTAYVALCARVLTSVFDVVVSLFTSGHRRVAVTIIRRKALKPLFAIGALAALSDAIDSDRLSALLGMELSGWLSASSSLMAALLSGWLVVRVRRPVQHLLRNRPYSQRHTHSEIRYLIHLLAKLWFVPVLLVIGASMLVIVLAGGSTEIAFAQAIISAVLLVLALVLTGLLRRQHDKPPRRLHKKRYAQRLAHFGYILAHCVVWAVFAELSFQVWGFSLLGIGRPDAINPEIGRALLAMALTGLIAWLFWIFADTFLERALDDGDGRRSRGKVTARAQTVVPMLRNTVFFTILIIAGIVGLANLGVNVTPLLAGAGIIGLAVGFGAQNLVQDLITGIFILVEDSLAVGDFVEVNGHMGSVEGLNLRTVRLRDLDGILHFITFSHISSIHNMSRQFGIALLKIRIPHDLPIDDAVRLMRETAAELRDGWRMGRLIRSPLEMQGIQGFEDGCPILRMRMRTAPEYQWDVARAFNLLLKQRMEACYVNLAAPRLSVSMEAGDGHRYESKDMTQKQGVSAPSGPQPDAT